MKVEFKEEHLQLLMRIRDVVGASNEEWAEELMLTSRQFGRIVSGRSKLPAHSLIELCEKYNLDPENFFRLKVDLRALYEHSKGNLDYIPEEFTKAAGSNCRTFQMFLESVEDQIGWDARIDSLRKIQIHEKAFSNPHRKVNIRLMSNYLLALKGYYNLKEPDFFRIGQHSYEMHRDLTFGMLMSSQKNVSEAYEKLIWDLSPYMENNNKYKISKMTKNCVQVDCCQNFEISEGLGVEINGSVETCNIRAGILSSAPRYLGMTPSRVLETQCVHRGDAFCRFVITHKETSYH